MARCQPGIIEKAGLQGFNSTARVHWWTSSVAHTTSNVPTSRPHRPRCALGGQAAPFRAEESIEACFTSRLFESPRLLSFPSHPHARDDAAKLELSASSSIAACNNSTPGLGGIASLAWSAQVSLSRGEHGAAGCVPIIPLNIASWVRGRASLQIWNAIS
jgi:hypothetical protein